MTSHPTRPSLRAETVAAMDAVQRGLGLARGRAGADRITTKGPRDVVTDTDVAVEDVIRKVLGDAADITVIGEERGGDPGGDTYWMVDPICGTRNFASDIPLYSVNVALVQDGAVAVAVVGDGSTGRVLAAERGAGAWSIDAAGRAPITVSAASESVLVETGYAHDERRAWAARFCAGVIEADRWDLRSFSSSLSLAYVASGRAAGYVLFLGTALHVGAGALLAAEAGAIVSDIAGDPWTIDSETIVAAAGSELHGELIELARRTGR
jgi:myo-inositol-1(or 4)-monophosphatase